MATKAPQPAAYERSDVCAVPAASVIVENVVAFEIAAAVVEKYVGTSLAAIKAAPRARIASSSASQSISSADGANCELSWSADSSILSAIELRIRPDAISSHDRPELREARMFPLTRPAYRQAIGHAWRSSC